MTCTLEHWCEDCGCCEDCTDCGNGHCACGFCSCGTDDCPGKTDEDAGTTD